MKLKDTFYLLALSAGCVTAGTSSALAQSVIFPQQQQAGVVSLAENNGVYILSNDLISAGFTVSDGTLKFNGSDALGLKSGSDLFAVTLGNNLTFTSSEMTMGDVRTVVLSDNPDAARGSEHIPGYAIETTFTKEDLTVVWRAVLRDGSHYLRTEMELSAESALEMSYITPMNYMVNPAEVGMPEVVGNTRGAVLIADKIFAGVESPMGINSCTGGSVVDGDFTLTSWNMNSFDWTPSAMPAGVTALGYTPAQISSTAGYVKFAQAGTTVVTFQYQSGAHRLNIAGVDLLDLDGNVVASDYHFGFTGNNKENNTYTLIVPEAGIYIIRYFIETRTETIDSSGSISFSTEATVPDASELPSKELPSEAQMTGVWERPATLEPGKTWKISSVVGLVAPGQIRRSFLAYSERERAVPWRSFSHYNSWYELNIDRNNSPTYADHMTIDDCVRVADQWKTNLYEKHGANIQALVWDDGWDSYGTWTFNPNFPDGFTEVDAVAKTMNTGIGAWLGPVGGYGGSGDARRAYWADKGGMTLGNPAYYKVFLDACTNLTNDYDFRFFKFDGISAQWSSVGPDGGADGIEKAEGIIQLEQDVREIKPDIFLNTTVGTWASPFWFRYTDAVWRQENDWGAVAASGMQAGCNDRERWITYRDRLVYQNFVQRSPVCPINTLMTHGFILTRFGSVSKDMSYRSILNELRCAFACGSGMIELYADYELLNKAYADGNGEEGQLWGEIARLIKWHEANADVLPDIHWVGGNPCDETTGNGEVYGWGAWNGTRSVLTLRNPNGVPTAFRGTLRQALEIPDYVTDAIVFVKPFDDQAELMGLASGEAIDIDAEINVMLPANAVYIFEGEHTTDTPVPPIPDLKPIAPEEPEESNAYPVNFPKDLTIQRPGNDRILNSLTLTPAGGQAVTIPVGDHVVYHNSVDFEVPVKAGQTIVPSVSYQGRAMHTYWYVDLNEDGTFSNMLNEDGTPAGELLSYSCYDSKNSLGEAVSAPGQVTPATNHSFTIPEATPAGIYRCRFKIDWNNVDPGGHYVLDEDNKINENGGYIIDFLIHVCDENVTVTANLPEGHSALLTAEGEEIADEPFIADRNVTLTIGKLTVEEGTVTRLIARRGYHLDNGSYDINGNPMWKEYEIPMRGNDTFNIPFDYVDRPVRLFAEVDGKGGISEIVIDTTDLTIYNLQGKKVLNPTPGIYIVNGAKTVIR